MRQLKSLISMCSPLQSGKDEAAKVLISEYGFTRFAFADVLKEFARRLNPVIECRLDHLVRLNELIAQFGAEKAKENPEVRRIYQVLGTECGRQLIGEDVWVNATELAIENSDCKRVVITDCRFPNEAAWVKRNGGYIWGIDRRSAKRECTHMSEALIESIEKDSIISNNSSLEDFQDAVRTLAIIHVRRGLI